MELQSNPASLAGFTTQGSATVGEFLPGTALGMTCEVVVSGRPGQIADLRRKCREATAHWLSTVNGAQALCNFSREARTAPRHAIRSASRSLDPSIMIAGRPASLPRTVTLTFCQTSLREGPDPTGQDFPGLSKRCGYHPSA